MKKFNEEEFRRKKSLRNSTGEGVFTVASNTITETYMVPYALSIGASNFQIGILGSMKSLADIVAQIPGARIVQSYSRKHICIVSKILSKLAWVFILLLPILFMNSVWILVGLISLSVFFQSLRRPAWTSIMGDLVKHEERGRYFSHRNAVISLSALLSTVISGFILAMTGFSTIFFISLVLGVIAIAYFAGIHEPYFKRVYYYKRTVKFNLTDIKNFFKLNRNFSMFTSYVTFFTFAVEISGSFIAVYLIKDLSLGYELFAVAVAVGILSRIVTQRYWGYFNDKYGSRKMLFICGVLSCFIPLFYLLSSNFYHILLVKIYDGIMYSGIELMIFNFLLDVTPSDKRPGFVANHNFLVGIGAMLGALVGAFMAQNVGGIFFLGAIQTLFLISFVLRFSSLYFLKFVKEVDKNKVPTRYTMLNPISAEIEKGMKNVIEFTTLYSYRVREIKDDIKYSVRERSEKRKIFWKRKKNFYRPS